jgi:hypothetical protein
MRITFEDALWRLLGAGTVIFLLTMRCDGGHADEGKPNPVCVSAAELLRAGSRQKWLARRWLATYPTFAVMFAITFSAKIGGGTVELESDDRTQAELLADAAIAKDQAAPFKRAADMIDDDLVQSALRARARDLETLVAKLDERVATMSPE